MGRLARRAVLTAECEGAALLNQERHRWPEPHLHVARAYFNRYTEDAVDLCDILSSFAPHSKASWNELSKIMGMPGKPEGIDGTDVERFPRGQDQGIADYCETDVVNTYRVWLRYELFRGRLNESEHQAGEENLASLVAARLIPPAPA